MSPRYFYQIYCGVTDFAPRSLLYDLYPEHPKLSPVEVLGQCSFCLRGLPSVLVPVYSSPLKTLCEAVGAYEVMHKDPAEIRIVCIRVREEEGMPHDIFGLARQFGWQYDEMEPERYGGDYGYAWEIPGKYIENVVTLGRLISRGFEAFIKPMPPDFTYSKMRALFLSDIITGDPYLVGRWFCGLAKTIDICVPDIAYHLYLDCLSGGYIDETNQVFCFKSIDGSIEFRDIDYMEQHVEPSIRLGISDELSGTDPSS